MAYRRESLAVGEYYHIYSRGVDKRNIFLDTGDKQRFLRLLYIANGNKPVVYRNIKKLSLLNIEKGECQVAIGAYCLMPNHFHLLIKETKEGGITKFMGKLLTSYSSYFNKKYERAGSLFGSEFRSSHLDTDEYLKYIFSYIHLNPIKKLINDKNKEKAEEALNSYVYSSYADYAGLEREEVCILNKLAFPEYFADEEKFKSNLFEWLSPAHQGDALVSWG